MQLSSGDRVIAGIAAAYFAYGLWSGVNAGIIDGEGDEDVHADHHPAAFVLTALSMALVVAVLAIIALGSNADDVGRMIASLVRS